jgi:hypothetical protein
MGGDFSGDGGIALTAGLVRMTEQIHDAVIFTTDSDFRTYRKNSRQIIPLIMPE